MVVEKEELAEITEAGVYTWCLSKDLLYGDTLVAALFGLDPDETTRGLPLMSYLERLHDDDRGDVRRQITRAVLNGLPYHAEYRVRNARGEAQHVMSLGRCFQDRNGMPVLYSGIVYPVSQLEVALL
jgi:PAS domain-containing protein